MKFTMEPLCMGYDTIYVDFKHSVLTSIGRRLGDCPLYSVATHRTDCTISVKGHKTLSVGVAFCSEKDTYQKHIGRRQALQRAMANAGYSRNVRTTIWKCYSEQVKIKNRKGVSYGWSLQPQA